MRYVPDNICTTIFNENGSGSCGYNSYCSMKHDRPTCKCPYGYSMVDPSNEFGGCQPNFTLACGADPKLTRLVPATPSLLETNLHSFTYETLEKATRGFSEEIGRGSSGVVYKGQLEAASCNLMIAI
ncbi:hypothetical protein JHK87_002402 [Glycine soja]|nr:hypothetical protein JHK87_002402 [Glycine soja]